MMSLTKSFLKSKTLLPIFLIIGLLVIPAGKAYSQGVLIPQSFFLESPYSITDVQANGEWIDLADSGNLWMTRFRADINLYENLLGVYVKVPFAGNSGISGEEGDFDIGNIGFGGKAAIVSTDQTVLTGGFELIVPTTSDNNGALNARKYFRDFVYFVDEAWTLVPYAVFGAGNGMFGFQANIEGDIMLNAHDIEGDSTEYLIKYGGTVSLTPELNLPFALSFLVDILAVTSLSFDDNITGAYVVPGIRVGGQTLSIGAGAEIPFGSDEVADFADTVLTGGFELIVPTTSDNNGALNARKYFRDFVYFVDEAWTLVPYAVFGAGNGMFGFQANIEGDIMLNAHDIEGDSTEYLIKYGGTVSLTPELNLPFALSFLVDILAVTSLSFDDNITGAYVVPGIRVGGQTLSIGAGAEIPFGSDEVADFADFGVVVDIVFRFGS